MGQAVIVPAIIPCGECELCKRNKGTICRAQKMPGNDIEGGFASHITVPAFGLCAVDGDRLALAGMTLADVSVVADAVTTPYQAVVQAGVRPGSLAVVIGVGGIGGFAAQIAASFGATVVAVDIDADRLAAISSHGPAKTFHANAIAARDLTAPRPALPPSPAALLPPNRRLIWPSTLSPPMRRSTPDLTFRSISSSLGEPSSPPHIRARYRAAPPRSANASPRRCSSR